MEVLSNPELLDIVLYFIYRAYFDNINDFIDTTTPKDAVINNNFEINSIVNWSLQRIQSGISSLHIYRLTGVKKNCTRLQKAFCSKKLPSARSEIDINSIANALKTYLRDLAEPLLGSGFYEYLVYSNTITNPDLKNQFLNIAMSTTIPPQRLSILTRLFYHLNEVTQHSATNSMGPLELAITWTPSLLRPTDFTSIQKEITAIQYLIENIHSILPPTSIIDIGGDVMEEVDIVDEMEGEEVPQVNNQRFSWLKRLFCCCSQ